MWVYWWRKIMVTRNYTMVGKTLYIILCVDTRNHSWKTCSWQGNAICYFTFPPLLHYYYIVLNFFKTLSRIIHVMSVDTSFYIPVCCRMKCFLHAHSQTLHTVQVASSISLHYPLDDFCCSHLPQTHCCLKL